MQKTSFNDFEFIRTLGKGAFSTVYLVKRKLDQKFYALKSITMGKLKENEQQNSINEIRILSSISHPNIIGFKESFFNEKNKTLNIVMEYCDDGDLETKIKIMKRNRQKFEEILIWNYFIQIIHGLKALHDKKILHRDLKSANIFLTKEKNQCKIGDLNASKVLKEKFLQNSQIGTPTYSSPEVWQNKPYSYKSDLWSVGCIIYEMCCLRPPFKGKNYDELCENICNGKIEKISNRYSEELWEIIKMMLEIDVDKRVDCDMILNHKFIKEQIKELKELNELSNNNIYMDLDIDPNNSTNDNEDFFLIDTIVYKNLRELENKIPDKKRYDDIEKKIKKNYKSNINNNKNNTNDDTIKNDDSFDECNNSEQKPINNIIKTNYKYNVGSKKQLVKGKKNKKKDIFEKIKKEEIFTKKSLIFKKKYKSLTNLNFKKIFFDIDFSQFKYYMNKSQKIINKRFIETPKIIKINIEIENQKKIINSIKEKNKNKLYERNSLINNIILFPKNKVIKSGLICLKEDIEKKISQKDLSISSFMNKSNDIIFHKISNSNPKYRIKKNNNNLKKKSSIYVDDGNNLKKNLIFSCPDTNENNKKEKKVTQIKKNNLDISDNTIDKKNNLDISDNNINKKNKLNELSKITGQIKKINKIKKNLPKKNKEDIKDIYNNNKTNENNNLSLIKNKKMDTNNKNKINKEKNNIQNILKIIDITKEDRNKIKNNSDKNIKQYNLGISNNNINKKNLKSNKYMNKFGKVIEIDISNINSNNSINQIKTFRESKNPFNTEHNKIDSFSKNISKEKESSKFINNQNTKFRLSAKVNNIKNFKAKFFKFGD